MNWRAFLSETPADHYIVQNKPYEEQIRQAKKWLNQADVILIGAGAGLSAAAGLTYGGKRFTDNFENYIKRYGSLYMTDMYSAGFYPFPTEEERWGYWSRHAYLNRVEPGALPLYREIYEMVKEKPHFVLTTNVDHQFWKAGFDDENIFATQGDYGLIQCKKACHKKTYDATELFTHMVQEEKDCLIPTDLVPRCPVCGGPMTMNLRCDQYFVEDDHWNQAAERYGTFLQEHDGEHMALLEPGVGFNTPVIIRFPFENMTDRHQNWRLIRLNLDEAMVPEHLNDRAVGINRDLTESIADINRNRTESIADINRDIMEGIADNRQMSDKNVR